MPITDINTNSTLGVAQFFALGGPAGVWYEWEQYTAGTWLPLQSDLDLTTLGVGPPPVFVGGLQLPSSVTVRARHFDTPDDSGTPTDWTRPCVGKTGAPDAIEWDTVLAQVQPGVADIVFGSRVVEANSTIVVLISPLAGGNLGTLEADFIAGAFPDWELLDASGGTIVTKNVSPVADGSNVVFLPVAWQPFYRTAFIAGHVPGYTTQVDLSNAFILPSGAYQLQKFTPLNNAYAYSGVLYTFAHNTFNAFITPEFADYYPFGEKQYTGGTFGGATNGAVMALYALGTNAETPLAPLPFPNDFVSAVSGVLDVFLFAAPPPLTQPVITLGSLVNPAPGEPTRANATFNCTAFSDFGLPLTYSWTIVSGSSVGGGGASSSPVFPNISLARGETHGVVVQVTRGAEIGPVSEVFNLFIPGDVIAEPVDGPFRRYQPRRAPAWLQDDNTRAWHQEFGGVKDKLLDRATEAIRTRVIALAAPDALSALAAERNLERYPLEPLETFRARIQGAWNTWEFAGTSFGLVRVLEQAGWRASVVEHFRFNPPVERWLDVAAPGDVWEDVSNEVWPLEVWAQFNVYVANIAPVYNTSPDDWADVAAPGDAWEDESSELWDVNYTVTGLPVDRLRALIRKFKAANAKLVNLVVVEPETEFWSDSPPSGDVWADVASDVWTDGIEYEAP
jgi:Phage tail protein (Tail_P2_I)